MAAVNGTDMVVLSGTTLIACGTDWTLNIHQDAIDATCKDASQWKNSIPGNRSWDASCNFIYDPDATEGFSDSLSLVLTGPNTLTVVFGGQTTGDPIWTGTAQVTEMSLNAPDNDKVTWSVSFMGVGAIAESVVGT